MRYSLMKESKSFKFKAAGGNTIEAENGRAHLMLKWCAISESIKCRAWKIKEEHNYWRKKTTLRFCIKISSKCVANLQNCKFILFSHKKWSWWKLHKKRRGKNQNYLRSQHQPKPWLYNGWKGWSAFVPKIDQNNDFMMSSFLATLVSQPSKI